MNRPTIEGCRAKADRAEAAIEEMGTEWRAWVDSNPYPSRIAADTNTGQYCVYFDFSGATIPLEFPVRVGEIAHDLRSALDHLVWREAVELLGHRPTKKEGALSLQFPIFRSRKKFVAYRQSKGNGFVGPDAWTIIERYQPYDRGKPKRSKGLELLAWINNMDKHRFIHGSSVWLGFFNPLRMIDFNPEARLVAAPLKPDVQSRPLKRDTEVACFQFDPNGPEPNVIVNRTPPLNISLGKAPRYIRSMSLEATLAEIRKVIDDFATLI